MNNMEKKDLKVRSQFLLWKGHQKNCWGSLFWLKMDPEFMCDSSLSFFIRQPSTEGQFHHHLMSNFCAIWFMLIVQAYGVKQCFATCVPWAPSKKYGQTSQMIVVKRWSLAQIWLCTLEVLCNLNRSSWKEFVKFSWFLVRCQFFFDAKCAAN